jgi:sugar phosphate isomerase/epimerase
VGADAFLAHAARAGFSGDVVVEINTRKCVDRADRERDLKESLDFAREHFAVPAR